jgi:CBS domain containing-hemolysin-like protein
MAPKSWAIAFPERAVRLIAVPARGLAWLLRPLLIAMNRAANRLVRWSGVEPVDRAAAGGHDADSLRHLVEHSAQTGALDAADRDRVIGALDLTRRTLGELPGASVPVLPAAATVGEVQDAARASGQMRVLVGAGTFVHVRDTLTLDRTSLVSETGIVRPLLVLDPELQVHEVLRRMREEGEQIIGVSGSSPRVVVLSGILAVVLPGSVG